MVKIFGIWGTETVKVKDPGLRNYINLKPYYLPHQGGRHVKPFGKSEVSIVERIVNKITVTGHDGKKHRRPSGRNTGKKPMAFRIIREALETVEKRTKKNPIQVVVDALSNASPREETTRIKYGGISYFQSVDVSPQRRLDVSIRLICVSASKAAFKNKKSIGLCLAEEIIAAAKYDIKCNSISKKEEIERIAKAAR
jgi:small subunit ribosomal protein S7|tara:strand:+ start:3625 stop:4215 length:591 start_codon:yes stop_codon:yes gene_type:complete